MTRTELATASERLQTAAERAETNADRLADLATQLARLAEADRGPDHGQLARIQTTLNDIASDADEAVTSLIANARGDISKYRETVEGV